MFKLNYYEVDESVQEFLWQSTGTDRQLPTKQTRLVLVVWECASPKTPPRLAAVKF